MRKLTWDDIESLSTKLAEEIKASGFVPDYIVGITIAGLIPLYYMARKLGNIRNILTISINSYDKHNKKEMRVIYLPEIDLKGKRVLVIDEISGTGLTLDKAAEVFNEKYEVGELKTATLVYLDTSSHKPDYRALTTSDDWIVFPWDKYEFPEHFE
jgi:hypothetical protein